jgi:hypothetical protein
MKHNPLPAVWVDKLFARLQGVYGRDFTYQFSSVDSTGFDVGLANARQVWAEELGGFSEHPEAIAYALENLPERIPNVIVFREICRKAPRKACIALEHKLTDEDIKKNKERLETLLKQFCADKVCGERKSH